MNADKKRQEGGSEPVDRREGRFRAGADTDVVGEVLPSDGAGGVDEEFGGARDVLAVGAGLRVQDSVLTDGLSPGVGENGERIAAGLAEPLGVGGRVDRDADDFDAAAMKVIEALLETPQLGVTERSPVATIENEHQATMDL